MNKIISNFYLIRVGGKPSYVGYTNRHIETRFREHLRDKDFGDDLVEVESLGSLEYHFTWDMELINSYAREVSDKETELILEYNTQDSVWQKGISGNMGGQTWANVKNFVRTNRDNPKFSGLSEDSILELIEYQRKMVAYLKSVITNTKPPEDTRLKNVITNTKPQEDTRLKSTIRNTKPPEDARLKSIIGNTTPTESARLKSVIRNTNPPEQTRLKGVINHTKPPEDTRLKHVINHTKPPEDIRLKNVINHTNAPEYTRLNNVINGTKAPEYTRLKNVIKQTKPSEETRLNNVITNTKRQRTLRKEEL